MGQIPMPFALNIKKSLENKGQICWVQTPGSGLEKRQRTLILCVCAAGARHQIVKPASIFRGKGNVSSDELKYYETHFENRLGQMNV